MKTRKILSVIITLAVVLSLFPVTASVSAKEMPEGVPFMFYNELTKEMCESVCVEYTPVKSTTTLWNNGCYVVDGNVEIDGRVTVTGSVKLILKDGCTLSVPKGIGVTEGNSLSVFAQKEMTGSLTASADDLIGHAAIGGNEKAGSRNAGTIAIHGGVISAAGNREGAGIGGGSHGNGDTVNIYGGKVSASGGYQGNGIGGSSGEIVKDGTVNIYGGEVCANGGSSATGFSGTVNVYGGNVFANGGDHREGINGFLNTYGGNVTANSGEYDGASISGSVLICGGTINANMHEWSNNASIRGSVDVAANISLINLNDGSIYTKGEGQEWIDLFGNGSVSVCAIDPDEPVHYQVYDRETGKFTEKSRKDYQILNKSMNTLASGCYVIMGVRECSDITVGGDVELILADWCDLTANGGFKAAGIHVGKNKSLTIYAQSDGINTGRLTANGGHNSAGIGSIEKEFVGTTTIYGGKITANGGYNGAGIGGGDFSVGGTTNIYGGIINATSYDSGAGIGSGHRGGSCTVNIYGGKVNATGGPEYCVGIGAGQFSSKSTLNFGENLIVINNATGEQIQKSEGQEWSEAIDCVSVSVLEPEKEPEPSQYIKYENGRFVAGICEKETYMPCPDIPVWQYDWYEVYGELTLGSVTVQGNVNLILTDLCRLTVNGGIKVSEGGSLTIYAQSVGENMGKLISEANMNNINAGIGGAGKVIIHGGDITAVGGTFGGAGIGGGAYDDTDGKVTIYGGNIEATGGRDGGAGIGSGYYDISYDFDDDTMYYSILDCGTAGTVEIFGGNITANGGYSSAGIGGGYGCDGGSITIDGGNISALGGATSGYCTDDQANGIGCGWFDMTGEYFGRDLSAPAEGGTTIINGGTVISNGDVIFTPFTLDVTGKSFTVTTMGKNAGKGIVTVALYDSEDLNRLLDVKVFELAKTDDLTGTFTKNGYVRAYWWSDFEKMIPLCARADGTIAE